MSVIVVPMARKSVSRLKKSDKPQPVLVLGVTGHRHIARRTRELAALVQANLEAIAAANPEASFTVLSALAEGADRLVVRLARRILGARLVAVLPMPAVAYEKDFSSARSRREFRALIETADRVIEAPILSGGRAWRTRSEARNHQYAWASAYVAKNADILFALWDGEPARGTGGTAYVVDWFLAGRTPRRYRMSRAQLRWGKSAHTRRLIHVNTRTSVVRRRRALL